MLALALVIDHSYNVCTIKLAILVIHTLLVKVRKADAIPGMLQNMQDVTAVHARGSIGMSAPLRRC